MLDWSVSEVSPANNSGGGQRFLDYPLQTSTCTFIASPSYEFPSSTAANMMRSNLLRSLPRQGLRTSANPNAGHAARTFATSARRSAEVELTVDGKKVSIEGRHDMNIT